MLSLLFMRPTLLHCTTVLYVEQIVTQLLAVRTTSMLFRSFAVMCLIICFSRADLSPDPGRILFFAPYMTKSIIIKAMPFIQGLAERGHQVVSVMPPCQLGECRGEHENITSLDVNECDGEREASSTF